jgi:hypothetical protein
MVPSGPAELHSWIEFSLVRPEARPKDVGPRGHLKDAVPAAGPILGDNHDANFITIGPRAEKLGVGVEHIDD